MTLIRTGWIVTIPNLRLPLKNIINVSITLTTTFYHSLTSWVLPLITLSTFIDRNHHQEGLKHIDLDLLTFRAPPIKFEPDSTKVITSIPKFKELKNNTVKNVEAFYPCLKAQIMRAYDIEYTDSYENLKK